jgi:hypothetical protein
LEGVRKQLFKFIDGWKEHSEELRKSKFSDYRLDYLKKDMCISDDSFDNRLMSSHSDNLRDKFRHRNFNRYKDMARLGRYNTYEFINTGNELKVNKYTHNHWNKNMSMFLKPTSKESIRSGQFIKDGLPLPSTKDCQFLGVVSGRKRRSRSHMREYEKDTLLDYFLCEVPEIKFKDTVDDFKAVYSGD